MNRKQLPASGQPRESMSSVAEAGGSNKGRRLVKMAARDDHWVALICRRGYNKWWFVRWDRRYDSR